MHQPIDDRLARLGLKPAIGQKRCREAIGLQKEPAAGRHRRSLVLAPLPLTDVEQPHRGRPLALPLQIKVEEAQLRSIDGIFCGRAQIGHPGRPVPRQV